MGLVIAIAVGVYGVVRMFIGPFDTGLILLILAVLLLGEESA